MIQKDEVRDKIVEVARKIFSQFGFRKTTVDEIAQAARKGKSSIYYYFSSKEDIFKAVVEHEAKILKKELVEGISMQANAQGKLKIYIIIRMQKFNELANFYEAIKSDYLSHLDFISKIREKYDKDEINMVQAILFEGVVNKEFKLDDTELAAIAIVTAMKGLEIPLFINKHSDLEKRLDDLLNILFHGMCV